MTGLVVDYHYGEPELEDKVQILRGTLFQHQGIDEKGFPMTGRVVKFEKGAGFSLLQDWMWVKFDTHTNAYPKQHLVCIDKKDDYLLMVLTKDGYKFCRCHNNFIVGEFVEIIENQAIALAEPDYSLYGDLCVLISRKNKAVPMSFSFTWGSSSGEILSYEIHNSLLTDVTHYKENLICALDAKNNHIVKLIEISDLPKFQEKYLQLIQRFPKLTI